MMSSAIWTDHWDQYLDRLPPGRSDVYLSEPYARLYEDSETRSECFIYTEDDNIFLLPYLKRRVPRLDGDAWDIETHYGYGGPATSTNNAGFLDRAFARFADEAAARGIIAGFVRFSPHLANAPFARPPLSTIFERHTVAMELAPGADLDLVIHPSHRRNIRQAERAGLRYETDHSLEHIDAFRDLYYQRMREIGATDFYFFPHAYFHALRTLRDHVFLGIVRYADTIVAAGVFFHGGPYGHYHLGASRSDAFDLRPNHFLHHRTALHLRDCGARLYHLGGGNSADETDPLFVFKRRFGSRLLDFHIGKMILDHALYDEACAKWRAEMPPDIVERYGRFLLCYRYGKPKATNNKP